MSLSFTFLLLCSCIFLIASAFNNNQKNKVVTLHNDVPRYDINGDYVDCHDGMILLGPDNATYYMYGEYYNLTTGATFPWPSAPYISVYTSPDLVSWTFRGLAIQNITPAEEGTQWIPNVFLHPHPSPNTPSFIMWYGTGDWTVATSYDGIAFQVASNHISSRLPQGTDGTGIYIDDDVNKTGYVVFAGLPNDPGFTGHVVSIEKLAPDYLSSTKQNVSGFFPDGYVESPALFKRNGVYYVTYGSCCCACRGGGGIVVFTSPSILGPWTRQSPYGDVNCNNATAEICGGFGARTTQRKNLVYNAQWWGVSLIPTINPTTNTPELTYLFTGRRWLSGENNPAGCDDLCGNNGNGAACTSPTYYLRSDYDVWYPFEFDDENGGIIRPLHNLPNFTLILA
jgi:hypothetical protein